MFSCLDGVFLTRKFRDPKSGGKMSRSIMVLLSKCSCKYRDGLRFLSIVTILFLGPDMAAMAAPNGASIELRTFNDCPISTVTVTNDFPAAIIIADEISNLCIGFANLHSWSFSENGGTSSVAFPNDSNFRFGADFKLDGNGAGSGGLRLSPWWAPYVDGRCHVSVETGEIACFGGRLPFYSFTTAQGIAYAKGATIRLEAAYEARGLSASSPGVIRYRAIYNGVRYDSPELPFDQGSPFDEPLYGLWGILNDSRIGGFFQVRANAGGTLAAQWSNISFWTFPVESGFFVSPDILNSNSKGRWLTGFIEPSPGYSAVDIDTNSLRLNGSVPAVVGFPAKIDDFDKDGISELEVRFDRAAAIASANARNSSVVMSITGRVAGDPFYGESSVTLISK
jgi:hypothetical protein